MESSFPEIPPELLRASRWKTKALGGWQRQEGIFVLEARALLKGLERAAVTRYGKGRRQLPLCDNMSASL